MAYFKGKWEEKGVPGCTRQDDLPHFPIKYIDLQRDNKYTSHRLPQRHKWVEPRNPDPALKWRPPTNFKMQIVLSQGRQSPHRGFLAAHLPPKWSNLPQNKTNVD